MPILRHDEIAESIIKCEGLTFALACHVGKEIPAARALLKDAICKALASEFLHGAEIQRRPEPA